jgi:chromate reductase, NAD(P)H dehydrogenase (quinone)
MNITAFAGSLRKESYNKALLRAAVESAPDQMEIRIFDLEDIPLFNADVEKEGDPGRVPELKDAVRKADGLLIVTPEYNHGMPGVTKNAIDWLSRPPKDAPIYYKPAGLMGASPSNTGTARSQDQLRQSLKSINVYCMPKPEILVSGAPDKFENGNLTDDATRKRLVKFMKSFAEWVSRFK